MTVKKKSKKKEFNDLLLPFVLIIGLLPFIMRLYVYESGLAAYPWFSNYDIMQDFSTFYKSCAFLAVTAVSLVILVVYHCINPTQVRKLKPFIPLAGYGFMVLVSSVFSKGKEFVVMGSFGHFEGLMIILGYMIFIIYAFQMIRSDSDDSSVLKVLIISSVLLSLVGILQALGRDPSKFLWVQKLMLPRDYWDSYLGNISSYTKDGIVSLTLYNPNYAAIYLSMLLVFFAAIIPNGSKSTKKIAFMLLLGVMFILLIKTNSRTGLAALLPSLVVLLRFYRKQWWSHRRYIPGILLIILLLFTAVDFTQDFRLGVKMKSTITTLVAGKDAPKLESIVTETGSISIRYDGEKLNVSTEETGKGYQLKFFTSKGDEIQAVYQENNIIPAEAPFNEMVFQMLEEGNTFSAEIDGTSWKFVRTEKDGYQYINDLGKYDDLKKIKTFGFHNLEYIGSGRGYIWSRTLPLLTTSLFAGNGPDTFTIMFPQEDYVGKANYSKTPYTLIDRAHNLYLMTWVQSGLISLLFLMIFIGNYLWKAVRLYSRITFDNKTAKLGLGCFLAVISYLISGMFNDSSIQISPLFWLMLGWGMSLNYRLECVNKNTAALGIQSAKK